MTDSADEEDKKLKVKLYSGLEVSLKYKSEREESVASSELANEVVWHYGRCHCARVQWRVRAPRLLSVWDCDCSICRMKGNQLFTVKQSDFELICGSESIKTYTFNTHKAKHMFCQFCGIETFYQPRSMPNGVGIQLWSVTSQSICAIQMTPYNGQNYEKSLKMINNNNNHQSIISQL